MPQPCRSFSWMRFSWARSCWLRVRRPSQYHLYWVSKYTACHEVLNAQMFSSGDYEKGVDHLTNAIAVCGQPQQLLQVLQQTLPQPVFQMLLTKLPSISQVSVTRLCTQVCRPVHSLKTPHKLPVAFWDKKECERKTKNYPKLNVCAVTFSYFTS